MDIAIFRPKVEQILSESDLETISAKRVRQKLSQDVGIDLKPYKRELDELIERCFEVAFRSVKPEPEEPKLALPASHATTTKVKQEVKAEAEEDDHALQAIQVDATLAVPRTAQKPTPTKRKRKAKVRTSAETVENSDGEVMKPRKQKRAMTNNGFNKLLTLSPALSAILGGVLYLSRPQVAKQIWAYIKAPERNLQDPADKRYINCNEQLANLLGTKRVHMFQMTKILQKHMWDDDTAPIGYGTGEDVSRN